MKSIEQVHRVYTHYANFYDSTFGRFFRHPREVGVKRLNAQRGERILEVGVGTGLSLASYPRDCFITAIDVCDAMLKRSHTQVKKHSLRHVTLANMDAEKMDFPDDSFDAIMAAYVITAVPDPNKVVQEMIRVCRQGGRILFLNHFRNGNQIIASMEKLLTPICQHLGFRPDIELHNILDGTALEVVRKRKVKPLGLGYLVECINQKGSEVSRCRESNPPRW